MGVPLAQMAMQRASQASPGFAPVSLHRASELVVGQNAAATTAAQPSAVRGQRASSPSAWMGGPAPCMHQWQGQDDAPNSAEKPAPQSTSRGAPTPGGAVRLSSGNQQAHSPPRAPPRARGSLSGPPPDATALWDIGETGPCLQSNCPTCTETRRRGFVLCRLPCGHTVRALVEEVPSGGCWGLGGIGARSESPPMLCNPQRERDLAGASSPPPRIMRQVSGIRNLPSVGVVAPTVTGGHAAHQQPAVPQSPPRGPGAAQQLTSRSNGGSGGGNGATGSGATASPTGASIPVSVVTSPSRSMSDARGEKVRRQSGGVDNSASVDNPRRHSADIALQPSPTTQTQVVTDSRGDVLHRMCNVILLSPQSAEKEQQLKVRGQIIGTYWDERDVGPRLDDPGEVQVIITYVDPSERSVPLLFPTPAAQSFGDTETTEGNIIKWKASLCKVGKKFS